MNRLLYAVIISLIILSAGNCSKKDAPGDPYPTDSLGKINRWILDSMQRYYLWSDEIPAHPDYSLSPELFFKSLLSAKDRFSWVSSGGSVPGSTTTYFTYGFQYALVAATGYNGYIGVVTMVNTGGAADKAGLQRGSCFTQLNGSVINEQNKNTVIQQLKTTGQVTVTPAVYDGVSWVSSSPVTLNSKYAGENAVHATRIFTEGGITTGYLFYNSFDENYDASLLQAFNKLKQASVSELILDLRYNAGGSVATSAKMAAMIAKNITENATWVIFEGNKQEGRKVRSLQAIVNTSANSNGKQYADLVARRLSLQRVFILTTAATYSAAELIVNNLKPYIDVVQIGETTSGKDEASFLVEDYRVPKQVMWKMQPTMYKVFNSNNVGKYDRGISPLYPVNEISQLPLFNIGSVADPLVNKALQIIYGSNLPDTFTALRIRSHFLQVLPVYRSAENESSILSVIKP
ncbi:MAG: S41 family peptidase [Chitinophagaceae bacterium]